ncbi:MAG: hypothetical protein ABIH49_02710 [archaeon]
MAETLEQTSETEGLYQPLRKLSSGKHAKPTDVKLLAREVREIYGSFTEEKDYLLN